MTFAIARIATRETFSITYNFTHKWEAFTITVTKIDANNRNL